MSEGFIVDGKLVQVSQWYGELSCNITRHVTVVTYCTSCRQISWYPRYRLEYTIQLFGIFPPI